MLVKTFLSKMPLWICTVRPLHLYMCVVLAILSFLFSNWNAALSSFSECSISLPPEALGWFGSTFWVITHLYCETTSYQFCSMWLDVSVYSQVFHDWDSLLLIFTFTPLWVTNEKVQSRFLTLRLQIYSVLLLLLFAVWMEIINVTLMHLFQQIINKT